MKKFILAVLAAFSMTACVFAASTTPQINWDKGLNSNIVVFGSGSSLDYTGYKGSRIGRESAIRDGVRNLSSFVNSVHVDAHTTVGDLVVTSEAVKSGVSALIRTAKIVGEGTNKDGSYWAKISLPLYGQNSLAEVVIPTLAQRAGIVKATRTSVITKEEFEEFGRDFYSGLVIDARGLGLEGTFSPVIYDEKGRYIYGIGSIDSRFGDNGIVEYFRNTAAVTTGRSRAGDSPLIIKAVTVRGGHDANMVDIVVSEFDGDRILLAGNNNRYMFRNCQVVVVM